MRSSTETRELTRVSGLCLRAANISFKFFESCLNLPPGSVIFDNFLNRKAQIGRKKCDPLGLAIDPHDFNCTLERFEHHDTVIGYNGSGAAIKIDIIFVFNFRLALGQLSFFNAFFQMIEPIAQWQTGPAAFNHF